MSTSPRLRQNGRQKLGRIESSKDTRALEAFAGVGSALAAETP